MKTSTQLNSNEYLKMEHSTICIILSKNYKNLWNISLPMEILFVSLTLRNILTWKCSVLLRQIRFVDDRVFEVHVGCHRETQVGSDSGRSVDNVARFGLQHLLVARSLQRRRPRDEPIPTYRACRAWPAGLDRRSRAFPLEEENPQMQFSSDSSADTVQSQDDAYGLYDTCGQPSMAGMPSSRCT